MPEERTDCTYCTEPDADVCVRVHGSQSGGAGLSVYAHRTCAEKRCVPILYSRVTNKGRNG